MLSTCIRNSVTTLNMQQYNKNNYNNYNLNIYFLSFFICLLFIFISSSTSQQKYINNNPSQSFNLLPPINQQPKIQKQHHQRRHPLIFSSFSSSSSSLVPQYTRFPLNIVVGLPTDADDNPLRNPYKLSIAKAQPVFDVAIEDIITKFKILPPNSLLIAYEDTQLSDAIGPQKIVNHYCNKSVDAVMGMAYVFALAPVARMSQFWGIGGVPVFTTTVFI
ncbi:unnamed protein product [Meloidogyne enterolobii]|uniref:Uncharacterized protein n=1 Tax=Meloidogyne enterolobii TaxID=390850 RepID=A0ACB0ZK90_MELEN